MRVLVVATKCPFPPHGGGSVALHSLVLGLLQHGVDARVIAPQRDEVAPADCPYPVRLAANARPRRLQLLRDVLVGESLAVSRQRSPALQAVVEDELRRFQPDVVHLEQLHLGWLLHELADRTPTVLRQQNVESNLLRQWAALRPPTTRWLYNLEASRLACFESWACTQAERVAAISNEDVTALRRIAPLGRFDVVPVAWPEDEPTSRHAATPESLSVAPTLDASTVVCLGSFDWAPNRHGALWFTREVWPRVRALRPTARLHLAGAGSQTLTPPADDVIAHGRVPNARAMYTPGAVSAIPVTVGSGVRVRLLESWAAGVPAVTTSLGGEGLVERDGDGALVANSPDEFAHAIVRLADDAALRSAIVARGRQKLASHRSDQVGSAALDCYRAAQESWSEKRPRSSSSRLGSQRPLAASTAS